MQHAIQAGIDAGGTAPAADLTASHARELADGTFVLVAVTTNRPCTAG